MNKLEAKALTKHYGPHPALSSVSLAFHPGAVTAIIGPNGSGKSTLLGVLAGTIVPDAGDVYIDDQRLGASPAFLRARKGIRRTFQDPRSFPQMTLREFLRIVNRRLHSSASMQRIKAEGEEATASSILTLFGMDAMADRDIATFSYGQQKLATLASLLLKDDVACYLLDEPVAGVSKSLSGRLIEVLRRKAMLRSIVVFVEHDMDFVRRTADLVVAMHLGKVIAYGPTAEVMESSLVLDAFGIRGRQ